MLLEGLWSCVNELSGVNDKMWWIGLLAKRPNSQQEVTSWLVDLAITSMTFFGLDELLFLIARYHLLVSGPMTLRAFPGKSALLWSGFWLLIATV